MKKTVLIRTNNNDMLEVKNVSPVVWNLLCEIESMIDDSDIFEVTDVGISLPVFDMENF